MTGAAAKAPAAAPSTRDARALAELMRTLQGNLLGIGIGNAVVALGMAGGLWAPAHGPVLMAWLGLQLLHSLFSVWAWWRVRNRPGGVRSAPRRARAATLASGASGLLWALSLPLFWPAARLDLQLLMITMITGLSSGAIHSLSAHLPAVRAFWWPNVAAVSALCLWQGGTLHAVIALAAVVYGVTGARFAKAMHTLQVRALLQREELAEVAADLAVQKERAEQASGAKTRFLAAASHDIRQPVHALGLFLGAFDAQALSGRNAELMGPLRQSARGLREMLDGVLDLSQAESGQVRLQLAAVSVQALLDMAERDYAPLAEAQGLVLRTVPSALVLHADALLTERVVRNLVSNAVRYTRRGGVLLGARRRGARVVLEVWDTGPGIAAQEQALVFEEFQRGAGAATTSHAGLGLGLAIARRFAQVQGGTLMLASRLGRGSVFRLTLPAQAEAVAPGATAAPPAAQDGSLSGLHVLLIEDDSAVRQATALLLGDWGCQVTLAANPDTWPEGLKPDVVLCDNHFAGQPRAHEVAARLATVPGQRLPLVVATGNALAPNLAPLLAQDVAVLAKPVEPARLRAALLQAWPVHAGTEQRRARA
jgi:signal transduction histidine kinase/CheY-like chemotaxis protein